MQILIYKFLIDARSYEYLNDIAVMIELNLLYILDWVILYNNINPCHRKPAELVEIGSVLKDKIPVIKRFTGGGTVIVDHQTVFITFICNTDALPSVQPYPRPIMSWSGQLYSKVFQGVGDFSLRENGAFFTPGYCSSLTFQCFCRKCF